MNFLSKSELSIENIGNRLSDSQIYTFYLGDKFKLGKAIHCPWRKDNNPSFGFFVGTQGILWKDFATNESGRSMVFVARLFSITLGEALRKINHDFNLDLYDDRGDYNGIKTVGTLIPKENIRVKKDTLIEVHALQDNNAYDFLYYNYFGDYGISKSTLRKYRVFLVDLVKVDGDIILDHRGEFRLSLPLRKKTLQNLTIGYLEVKDGKPSWKIYRPLNKSFKWLTNAGADVLQGWSNLPICGEQLIITKSLKDVMVLYEMGFNSIAVQSESITDLSDSVITDLKNRFTEIYVLFDKDEAGFRNSRILCEKYNLNNLTEIVNMGAYKDISDYAYAARYSSGLFPKIRIMTAIDDYKLLCWDEENKKKQFIEGRDD